MDLMTFVMQLERDRAFDALINNPALQFGTNEQPYLGAELLPERLVEENFYTEWGIRYMTVVASHGARYAPVQRKDAGDMFASFDVKLADQDIGAEFTSRDYDALVSLVRQLADNATLDVPEMQAAADRVLQWADVRLLRGLLDLNEKDRWDAIRIGTVDRRGDNAYREMVEYPKPAGHRVTAGGTWSDDTYDPFDEIVAMADLLTSKGYTVDRIITSRKVRRILEANEKIRVRFADPLRSILVPGLDTGNAFVRMNVDQLRTGFERNDLPAPIEYERQYRDGSGLRRYVPDDCVIFLSTTGREDTIPIINGERFLPNTAGYFAIGRAVGQANPGRVIRVEPKFDKPPRIEGEAWQTGLPVITEPESIAVISGIS